MTRKRGRPSQSEGPAITRQSLLENAARLIGRDGFDGASMRKIASASNVSLATLQHYFRTKTDLWQAIIDELLVPAMDRRQIAQPENEQSHLAAAIATRLDSVISRPGLSGRILTDCSDQGLERLQYLAQATAMIRETDRMLLEALQSAGTIRAVDIDALQVLIGIAISTLSSSKNAVRMLIGPDLDDSDDRSRLVNAITDLLINGLRPR